MTKNLLFILIFSFNSSLASEPKIKVKIGSNLKKINISGNDLTRLLVESNKKKELHGNSSINFNCSKVLWKNWKKRPLVFATIKSKNKVISWHNKKYTGKIQIQTSENFKGCDLVNEISVEDYISMLLPKEMNAKWPLEALKAQAIAARSYALFKIRTKAETKAKGYNTHYDLENSERHQVNGNYSDLTLSTVRAAGETHGEILVNDRSDKLPVFFHSKCGGHTFLPEEVWSNPIHGYERVQCPYCHGHGMKNWKLSLTNHEFLNYYKKAMKRYAKKNIDAHSKKFRLFKNSEYNPRVKIFSGTGNYYNIKKSRLRSTLSRARLPSNNFDIKAVETGVSITGGGFGHGVGLCQFGAKEMALRGYSYKEILKHYFPKLKILKVY